MNNELNRINVSNTDDVNPNFYVLNFENKDNHIMAFTHYSPATIFKGKLFFNTQSEIYKKCISISTYVDCLYYKIKIANEEILENIVIFKGVNLSLKKIFDYKDDYIYKAQNAIKSITDKKLLSDIKKFSQIALQDEFIIKKLAKIFLENKIELVTKNFNNLIKANNDFKELDVQIDETNKIIIIPEDVTKEYVKAVMCLLNTEPIQNIITEDKLLLADNNVVIQQKLFD
ncbi:MAG: DUF4868 domain-containing protein [Desulfomicrobium escambiense]|nr:DUF4868 domain-containing protein [Desulfomicrobium escambiense]